MVKLRCWASLGLFVLGVACGSSDPVVTPPPVDMGSDGGGGQDVAADASDMGSPETLSDAQISLRSSDEQFIASSCEALTKCCTPEDASLLLGLGPEEDCAALAGRLGSNVSLDSEFVATAVDEGRVAFDAEASAACATAFEGISCGELMSLNPLASGLSECEGVLVPLTATGAGCQFEFECAEGYCSDDGRCTAFAVEGEACTRGACVPGTYCDDLRRSCLPSKELLETCSHGTACLSGLCAVTEGGTKRCLDRNPLCGS